MPRMLQIRNVPDESSNDHRVVEAYLGKEMEDAEVRAVFRA